MNFLSHYFVRSRPKDPLFNLGLILPDLFRGSIRQFELTLPGQNSLLEGCLAHIKDDKQFHASLFFEQGAEACLHELKLAPGLEEVERKWFLAHILFEMLMDRLLVRHLPGLCLRFYADLESVDKSEVNAFLKAHYVSDSEVLLRRLELFTRAAYIRNYTDNNLFGYSLTRVMMRVGLPELGFKQRADLQACVNRLEQTWFKEVQTRIFEMKQVTA